MNKVFIEEQFPVSKISKESYKERKANLGQTLTGLGKWWGRKPLILVRASILGMLMPASDDAEKDREIFLKILTMDEGGLLERKIKNVPLAMYNDHLAKVDIELYCEDNNGKLKWKRGVSRDEKVKLDKKVFGKLSYDQKIALCCRPEEIDGPSPESFKEINAYLDIEASSLHDIFQELSKKTYGKVCTVGDVFCGGGSIPFEAARCGVSSYGSDLNPAAGLLSWASLNVIGGEDDFRKKCESRQVEIYSKLEKAVDEWGIEKKGNGDVVNSLIYCVEVDCPSCKLKVPLSPSWVLDKNSKAFCELVINKNDNNVDILIHNNGTENNLKKALELGTIKSGRMYCPQCENDFSISSLRDSVSSEGLREWGENQYSFGQEDLYGERLYAIQWQTTTGERYYAELDNEFICKEEKVKVLLDNYWDDWKEKGFIPSRPIPRGYNTDQLVRERGWKFWSHLFTPRQLLIHGYLSSLIGEDREDVPSVLGLGRIADWDSRLGAWMEHWGKTNQVFYNQAFNTFFNYASRGLTQLKRSFFINYSKTASLVGGVIEPIDARNVQKECEIWITDPPYADAVNYHELSEFFLAWYAPHLKNIFPGWSDSSRDALAVKGSGENFKKSMVDVYKNLNDKMPENGLQMVQFTHQDPAVWADLAMIMWAAGLRVTSAWTIGTEMSTGLKKGNYVQGTVLLVLRKRVGDDTAFLDELYPEIEDEVKIQLDNMLRIDDRDDPNFADTDYQLAAYAAALRVLTRYSDIDGQDIAHELFRVSDEKTEFEKIIDRAVEIACDHLVPEGFDTYCWKGLSSIERLYLKGLELEKHLEARAGAYQELAKGFGVSDYTSMYARSSANTVRFKSASEFKKTQLGSSDFGDTLLRNILFSIYESVRTESIKEGLLWLRNEVPNYWNQRKAIVEICRYLSSFSNFEHMSEWKIDAEYAKTLEGAVHNDHEGQRL